MDEDQTLTPLEWMRKKVPLFYTILIVPFFITYILIQDGVFMWWDTSMRVVLISLYPAVIVTLWSTAYAGVVIYHFVRRLPAKGWAIFWAIEVFLFTLAVYRVLFGALNACGGWEGFTTLLSQEAGSTQEWLMG